MDVSGITKSITNHLDSIGIQDETFAEYFVQILQDDSIPREEKQDIISEFIQNAVEEYDCTSWVSTIIEEYLKMKNDHLKREKENLRIAVSSATNGVQNNEEPQIALRSSNYRKNMSNQERKERELMLAKYGYEVDEIIENAHGDIDFIRKKEIKQIDIINIRQMNRDIVREKEEKKKELHKNKKREEKQRNKELLEKQRLEKEAKKKGTQKREKVRG